MRHHFLEGCLMVVASGEQKTYFTLTYAYIAFTYKLKKETSLKVI